MLYKKTVNHNTIEEYIIDNIEDFLEENCIEPSFVDKEGLAINTSSSALINAEVKTSSIDQVRPLDNYLLIEGSCELDLEWELTEYECNCWRDRGGGLIHTGVITSDSVETKFVILIDDEKWM